MVSQHHVRRSSRRRTVIGVMPFSLNTSGHHEYRSLSPAFLHRLNLFFDSQSLIEAAGMRMRSHLSVVEPKLDTQPGQTMRDPNSTRM